MKHILNANVASLCSSYMVLILASRGVRLVYIIDKIHQFFKTIKTRISVIIKISEIYILMWGRTHHGMILKMFKNTLNQLHIYMYSSNI